MAMILLEEMLVAAFKAAGIKASTQASEEWTEDYVSISRNGGDDDPYGSAVTGRSGRERVEIGFNVYSTGPIESLRLAYRVRSICRDLPLTYRALSNPLLSSPADIGWFNQQYGYTLDFSVDVLDTN